MNRPKAPAFFGIWLFLVLIQLAAQDAPITYGDPKVGKYLTKFFGYSIPVGKFDPALKGRIFDAASGKTYFRSLYEYFLSRGTSGELVYGNFDDFTKIVCGNLDLHKQTGKTIWEVIIAFTGHGVPVAGLVSYDGKWKISFDTIAKFLQQVRSRMDNINPKAHLVIIGDFCYSELLYDALPSLSSTTFLGAAPRDQIGIANFLSFIWSHLYHENPSTWRKLFLLLGTTYRGWTEDCGKPVFITSVYVDEAGTHWRYYPDK